MAFNILEHLKRLEPDGGSNDPRGDHSFHCPACGAPNFKVNIRTGKWAGFNCDCANTEAGKRRIRDAVSPAVNPEAKPPRQKQDRHWDYFTAVTLERGAPALTVRRLDNPDQPDGNGWKDGRKIWQQSLVDGHRPAEVAPKVLPYGFAEAKQALADGAPFVFWVEGEPCVDALRTIGLPAVTSIGGAGKFKPDRDAGLFPADRLVVCPDRDKCGLDHAEHVAASYPGCLWLYAFPGTPQWNGSCPPNGGLDIADWIGHGVTVEQILAGIGPKRHGAPDKPVANHAAPEPSSDLDQLLGTAEEGKLRRPRTDKLSQAVGLLLPLRYNLLTNRIERNGEPIHGDYLGGLYLELAENHGLEVAKDRAIDAAIRVARQNAYHPVQDYLNGITDQLTPEEWASLDLHCFGGEDPTGWGVIHLQRQLIGLVARALNPGCELHTCVVLQSDQQGIGKSTFWKILGGPWFSDSLGDLRDVREDRLQLHSAWIHEWGEIDNVMGKRESETLKRFISSSRDDVRRPYGRGTEQLLRSCGLVGTTNRRDFIKDPTGNRRFPIIQIRKVQLDWVKANRERMWGSAVAAYRAGQQWHYDTTENASISKAAQDYAAEDPLRDQIETWIDDHPDITAIAMPVIVFHLNRERQRDQEFARQVALRLTALGWRKSQQRERGYLPNGDRHDKATIWVAPAPTSGPPS